MRQILLFASYLAINCRAAMEEMAFLVRAHCNMLADSDNNEDNPLFAEGGICNHEVLDNSLNRQYTDNYKALFGTFNGYGCYCYFFDNYKKGRGQSQSQIDDACKTLQMGYRCIEMDAVTSGIPCPHQETKYQTGGNFLATCDENPVGSCARNICEIEMMFVQTIFQISNFGPVGVDQQLATAGPSDLRHSDGIFNEKEKCWGRSGRRVDIPPYEWKCCGVFPFRWPYKDIGVGKKCCEDGTFRLSCP